MGINKNKHILIDLDDGQEILISNLGNRGKYLTLSECIQILGKVWKSIKFAMNNDIHSLNSVHLKREQNEG